MQHKITSLLHSPNNQIASTEEVKCFVEQLPDDNLHELLPLLKNEFHNMNVMEGIMEGAGINPNKLGFIIDTLPVNDVMFLSRFVSIAQHGILASRASLQNRKFEILCRICLETEMKDPLRAFIRPIADEPEKLTALAHYINSTMSGFHAAKSLNKPEQLNILLTNCLYCYVGGIVQALTEPWQLKTLTAYLNTLKSEHKFISIFHALSFSQLIDILPHLKHTTLDMLNNYIENTSTEHLPLLEERSYQALLKKISEVFFELFPHHRTKNWNFMNDSERLMTYRELYKKYAALAN